MLIDEIQVNRRELNRFLKCSLVHLAKLKYRYKKQYRKYVIQVYNLYKFLKCNHTKKKNKITSHQGYENIGYILIPYIQRV